MTSVPGADQYARPAVRPCPKIVLFCALVVVAAACAKGESTGTSSGSTAQEAASVTASPVSGSAETSPFEVVVTDDTVRVSITGITTTDGVVLLSFSAPEQACVAASAGAVGALAATLDTSPGATDDPDGEQTLAEIVVGCVSFDRFQPVVADQLARQAALADVDPACLDRDVASLQDTPGVLASVLRGDPDALSVIAGTVATNCP